MTKVGGESRRFRGWLDAGGPRGARAGARNARELAFAALATLCAAVGVLALAGAPAQAAGVRGVVRSFGPAGPGSGVFEEPQSIAVEQSSGDVYVYQAGNGGVIYKFKANGEPADFSSTNEITGVGSGVAGKSEIAVDSSSGLDEGDIYVATGEKLEIYTSAGEKETPLATKEEPCGVAVDPSGAVYVAFEGEEVIKKYTPTTSPVKAADYTTALWGVAGVCNIAVDSAGDVYAAKSSGGGGVSRYEASEFNTLGLTAIGMAVDSEGATLALDPSSGGSGGELYVDEKDDIAEYTPPATRVASFGSLSGSYGVAEDHASGEVYAAEEEEGEVAIYGQSSEYPLTVRQAGFGAGTVQCAVDGGAAGACASEYPAGAVVTLTATPGSGSEFKGFSEACTNSVGPCEVTIDAASSVTATFAREGVAEHTLTVSPKGSGAVSAGEGAISHCSAGGGVCAGSYPVGEEVTLTATPGEYQKVAWKDCTSVPSENVCIVKIGTANATVTATFTAKSRTVTVVPTGPGSVSANKGTISDCSSTGGVCSDTYLESEQVQLEGNPKEYYQVEFSDCVTGGILLPDDCFVYPGTGNVTVPATFTPKTHTVTVTPAGSGSGSVSAGEGEIKDCAISKGVPGGGTCSGPYDEGKAVTLEATPAEGSTVAWSANCTSLVEDTCTVDVDAANVTVTATFTAAGVTEYKLKVIPAGTGTGTVTSSPAGIACGPTCEASFEAGKKVELKAAAGSGSTFAGWSVAGQPGACAGTGSCEVTISAAESVTATFNKSAVTEYKLKVIPAGTGTGTVTSSPAGIACGATCEASFEAGKKVELKATAGSGSTFAGWSVAGQPGACAGTGSCEVTISAAESVTASFTATVVAPGHEFLGSFGPGGPGLTLFEEPQSVAVEQRSGDVYVYEVGEQVGGRIYKFNAAGEPVAFSSSPSHTNEIKAVGGFEGEGEIAVDSSSGPDHGDIYLATGSEVEIFSESGEELAPLTKEEGKPTEEAPCGVAVDPSGAVYVMFSNEDVKKYLPETSPVTKVDYESSLWKVHGTCNIAADFAGDIYTVNEMYNSAGKKYENEVIEYEASQFESLEVPAIGRAFDAGSTARAVAVDPSPAGAVYVDEGTRIAEYNLSGTRVGTFAESVPGTLKNSYGIAVNRASGEVYASEYEPREYPEQVDKEGEILEVGPVNIYAGTPAVGLPEVSAGPVSELQGRSATLNGTVNPGGVPVTACEFEYGASASYGHSEPCSAPVPFSGRSPVPVSAHVGGLERGVTYHFRLSATNEAGEANESTGEFSTAVPAIAAEWTSGVSSTAAELHAQIDPYGIGTSYYFQYGPTASYGSVTPGADIGSGQADESVVQPAQGLAPSTTYHYRVVAVQGAEEFPGPDHTFTTQPAGGGFALPDGREWEMVSPPDKDGAEPEPVSNEGSAIQASEDGGAISYVADGPMPARPTPAEGEGEGNVAPSKSQILSTRDGVNGWVSQDITTPTSKSSGLGVGVGNQYRLFSSDLALALEQPVTGAHRLAEPPLSPQLQPGEVQEKTISLRADAPLQPEESEAAISIYAEARRNGELLHNPGYLALLTEHNDPPGAITSEAEFQGATPDLSHVVFNAEEADGATGTALKDSLYEWAPGGIVQPVSVFPPAGQTSASQGEGSEGKGYLGGPERNIRRHAISNDGTLVFWTGNEHLYVRDTKTEETLQVDAAQGVGEPALADAMFQTASADGSKVFFTDTQRLTAGSKATSAQPDLYMFELGESGRLTGTLRDLTPEGVNGESAGVAAESGATGVLGASEDGSYVYLVARGVLTEAENGEREKAALGGDNLYVLHDTGTRWTPTFIAGLSSEDAPDWGKLFRMSSRVSPNGQYLAFMSDMPLTGYDNVDANPEAKGARDEEVFLYRAAAGSEPLVCASCDPSGARPEGILDLAGEGSGEGHAVKVDTSEAWNERWLAGSVPGWTAIRLDQTIYQSRYLSDSGRLFFDSPDHLAPAATGYKEKVYEYEPTGEGSCDSERGCVGLISPGTSEHEAAFLEADASGSEAFFLTADPLVPQDTDAAFDVYDAHECTSSSPCPPGAGAAPPACTTAESCREAPAPQPEIFGAPSSETFAGAGALAPVSPKAVAPKKTAAQIKAEKLARALKACRKDKQKKRRATCERRARKKYRAKKPKAKAKTKSSTRRGER